MAISYVQILFSYLPFVIAFVYCFYLMIEEEGAEGNIVSTAVRVIVMLMGEFNYDELDLFWLGEVVFVLFVFLLCVVLMSVLNGLAVSNIGKVLEEVDYRAAVVDSLCFRGGSINVPLLAEGAEVLPNQRKVKVIVGGVVVPEFMPGFQKASHCCTVPCVHC